MKNFIYGDFESKYERTVFKKVPGAPPVAIFYTQSGKELERVNLEKFDRYVCYIYSFILLWVFGHGSRFFTIPIHSILSNTQDPCQEKLTLNLVLGGLHDRVIQDDFKAFTCLLSD